MTLFSSCSIFKVPDAHKHITRPPAGVIFPEKSVTAGDLKPPPVLWHEDTGRKPFENGRHNPPGSISGKQLGDAAHRLVINSLQINRDHYGSESRHGPVSYSASANSVSYPNGRHYGVDQRTEARAEYQHGYSQGYGPRNSLDNSRGQWHDSSRSSHHYERSLPPQYERDDYSRPYYSHNGSSHHDARGRVPVYNNYSQGGGYPYPSANRPVHQPVVPHSPYVHPQVAYSANYGGYQDYGVQQQLEQHYGAERAPPSQQHPSGRLYGHHHQQGTNQYLALDRGSNRRPPPGPPPPGYGRQ
ncbi:hypothetical protein Cni_G12141 [Canna indica]|uniref:Uncharacterized protein n=1 Tax=Canna indica TaxID=4628 RepID=A0AAQ3QBI4_9LILI|nr:hypothetical protein Cni_G12141 [Canna indica]